MKYYLDTEFHEYEKDGTPTIELISIGIVAENGKEYYAISNEFDVKAACENTWLADNVLMPIVKKELVNSMLNPEQLGPRGIDIVMHRTGIPLKQIALEIKEFIYQHELDEYSGECIITNIRGDEIDVEDYEGDPGVRMITELWCNPIFYAYYADYDWVRFCWLFGRMIDLPKGFPMYCRDLKQILDDKGNPDHTKAVPQENEHNALEDARWNKRLHEWLDSLG